MGWGDGYSSGFGEKLPEVFSTMADPSSAKPYQLPDGV